MCVYIRYAAFGWARQSGITLILAAQLRGFFPMLLLLLYVIHFARWAYVKRERNVLLPHPL